MPARAQQITFGVLAAAVEARLAQWDADGFASRLWARDHTLWADDPDEITNRLGWLTLPETMRGELGGIESFAEEVAAAGTRHVVLLGMGGSSLAPDVWQRTFGHAPGRPELIVLDSTHPAAVQAVDRRVEPDRTLFLVSSKSGTTVEPLSLFRYFWNRTGGKGRQFAAITDPGSQLVDLGAERDFRHVFTAEPDVGGRYSALTHFGLVPAALIGVDVAGLLDSAAAMVDSAGPDIPARSNPALVLGALLGEAACAGRDKATYVTSPALTAFPDWVEQLVAESTGKQGTGIVPVAGEPLGQPDAYGADRLFVYVGLYGDEDPAQLERLDALEKRGHPVARYVLGSLVDLAGQMYRAEMAVAAAGAVLGINPFDQPDVERAKQLAREALAGDLDGGDAGEVDAGDATALADRLRGWVGEYRDGDYVALQAYLPATGDAHAGLHRIRMLLRDRLGAATTVGYGPRYLHSTGQLHKGGPGTGLFLQLVDRPADEVPVPETDYTFAELIAGQAHGDLEALRDEGRRVLRVQLGADPAAGLAAVEAALA